MNAIADELRLIVSTYGQRFHQFSEEEFAHKPRPEKWSRKEVLGHLIDSAQNNLRRFICAQYEDTPPRIKYEQNFWVQANQYQHASQQHVIALWQLINEQIATVLVTMPADKYNNTCDVGALRTLEWLAADYVKHLKHHINQIIPASFDIVYP